MENKNVLTLPSLAIALLSSGGVQLETLDPKQYKLLSLFSSAKGHIQQFPLVCGT